MELIRRGRHENPKQPLVSVVTPCYNYCEQYLPETIESIDNQTYGNIEHLILHCNCGTNDPITLPAARNILVREANGPNILPLDADDKFVPHAISAMVSHIRLADIISSLQMEFGDSNYAYGNPTYSTLTYAGFYLANRIHCASMYSKQLWEEIGGYDENLIQSYEDWDFWLRCAKAGKSFFVVPQLLFQYRRHAGSLTSRVVAGNNAMKVFRRKWPI